MKSIKTFLLVSCSLFCLMSNAQNVAELYYKNVYPKKKKSVENAVVKYGQDFAKIQTLPAHSRNPARYIDKKNNLLVMDFEANRDFIIEELDSVYRINCELKKTGEKQVINGYNCEEYSVVKKITYGGLTGTMFQASQTISYDFHIWITNDLVVDETFGINISQALTFATATFPYTGVIVKLSYGEAYDNYIALDSVVTNKELPKDFARPWVKHEKPVAILAGNSDGYAVTLKYTRENLANQFKRMKALLVKVTGIEKPKFKTGLEGIAF